MTNGVSNLSVDIPDPERLRVLSEEVNRIAVVLARMSYVKPEPTIRATNSAAPSVDSIRQIIRARRLRGTFWPDELFADPAWDMLLDLFQAELGQLRVATSSLCIAASVPATTALRWLNIMAAKGLVARRADPHDGRRVYVELTPATSEAMRQYFAAIGSPAVT